MTRGERALEVRSTISEILRRDWDPIGVAEEPAAAGEYDTYVGGIYRLLVLGGSVEDVAEHLSKIESERMGLARPDLTQLLPVAQKLVSLDVRL